MLTAPTPSMQDPDLSTARQLERGRRATGYRPSEWVRKTAAGRTIWAGQRQSLPVTAPPGDHLGTTRCARDAWRALGCTICACVGVQNRAVRVEI